MLLVAAAHGDGGGVDGRSKGESSQGSQDGNEHELRGKENHVGQVGIGAKERKVRPVAKMSDVGDVK